MKLKVFKQESLEQLKRDASKQIDLYQRTTPWLNEYFRGGAYYCETQINLPDNLSLLTNEGEPSDTDKENSKRIYEAFRGRINPVQAAEERLWTYLCHETFWDYMIWRWPPKKEGTIISRYFFDGESSRALSRNGISRLWWFAHLTYDESRNDPYELTNILLYSQDIQHNLLERNFGRNRTILHTVLDFLRVHPEIKGKEQYVKIVKTLNRLGGVRLLDALGPERIKEYIESKILNR